MCTSEAESPVGIFLTWTLLKTIAKRILSLLLRRLIQEKERVLLCLTCLRKKMDTDVEFLKELGSLREGCSKFDDDKYFLLSLLPLVKKLSLQANMMFRIEIQQNLMQKLFPVAPSAVPSPKSSDFCDTSYTDMSFPNFHQGFFLFFFLFLAQFTIAWTLVSAFATIFFCFESCITWATNLIVKTKQKIFRNDCNKNETFM